jgi:hypothetical protein
VPEFVEVGSPTDDEVHALLQAITTRLMKMLTRRGVLVEDMGQTYMAEPDADGQESRTPRPRPARPATVSLRLGKVGLTQQQSRNTAITAAMALLGSIRGLEDVAARGLPPLFEGTTRHLGGSNWNEGLPLHMRIGHHRGHKLPRWWPH